MIDNNISTLDEITKISTQIDVCLSRLSELCKHEDEEVRLRSIEALENVRNSEVEEIIRTSRSDPDEMVRIASLEILGTWKDRDSVPLIVESLSDSSWLVRSQAVVALAEIGAVDQINVIEERLRLTDNEEEQVRCFWALYRLGKNEYCSLFLNGLFHEFYRIRCATANLLPDIITASNKDFVKNLLQSVLKDETTNAAKSSIENALNEIG